MSAGPLTPSGRLNYQQLITELKQTVADLAREAQKGDEGARKWLIECFPAHLNFFLDLWPETPAAATNGKKERVQMSDTPQYTEYQLEFARVYGVHPSLAPASEADIPETNPGQKRKTGLQISPPQPLSLEEQARDLASRYGVADPAPFLEQLRKEAGYDLMASRLARRDELAKKYNVRPEHIPLHWLEEE